MAYEYIAEDDRNVDLSRTSEARRIRSANRYLKRVKYGNRQPLLLDSAAPGFRRSHVTPIDLAHADWMFESGLRLRRRVLFAVRERRRSWSATCRGRK